MSRNDTKTSPPADEYFGGLFGQNAAVADATGRLGENHAEIRPAAEGDRRRVENRLDRNAGEGVVEDCLRRWSESAADARRGDDAAGRDRQDGRPAAADGVPAAGVEYRTLSLNGTAFSKLLENREICRDFAPGCMGVLLILQQDWYDPTLDRYEMLAELVAVRDECVGQKRRFIWRFVGLTPITPFPGRRVVGAVGRLALPEALAPKATS